MGDSKTQGDRGDIGRQGRPRDTRDIEGQGKTWGDIGRQGRHRET